MEIKAAGSNQKQLRVIARKLLEKAADGDMQAISCVADRLDGKPLQQMEVATDAQPFAVIPQQLDSAAEWEAAQKPQEGRRLTRSGQLAHRHMALAHPGACTLRMGWNQ